MANRRRSFIWVGAYLGLGAGAGFGATVGSALVSPLFWLACSVAGLAAGVVLGAAASLQNARN